MFWFQYLRPYATGLFLAVILCHKDTLVANLLVTRPMRYIATISYALYVIHPLTVHGWFNQGTVFERYLLKRPISFFLTFAAAHLSTFYWESYWMRTGRNWIKARRAKVAKSIA